VPVWDNCNYPIGSGTAGQKAQVIGFLEMFVDGMGNQNACASGGNGGGKGGGGGNGSYVKIHTINATGCAEGSGGSGGGSGGGTGGGTTPTGPAAVPVQLIKN
jgi:hypothetical protein